MELVNDPSIFFEMLEGNRGLFLRFVSDNIYPVSHAMKENKEFAVFFEDAMDFKHFLQQVQLQDNHHNHAGGRL